jgi:hypothetical protein
MGEDQRQDETALLEQQVSRNLGHADEQRRGQRKAKRQLAETRSLVRVERMTPACEIAQREHEKDRKECSDESADVHERLPLQARPQNSTFVLNPKTTA